MHYRKLGNTCYMVGEVGFGAWSLALEPDDEAAIALVRCAVQSGANFVDVADVYDGGRCESLVGRALEKIRGNAMVATKCGLVEHDGRLTIDFNPARIARAVQESRERLRSDYIDLLQLHYPTPHVIADPALWETLSQLSSDGVVKHVGVVADSTEAALAAVAEPRVETLQVVFNAAQANLLPVLQQARAAGKGVIARAPLLGGLLARRAGGAAETETSLRDPLRTWPSERLRTLSEEAERFHLVWPDDLRTQAQSAIGWVLAHQEIAVTIPGARTPAQLEENLATSDLPLPSARRMAAVQHLHLTSV